MGLIISAHTKTSIKANTHSDTRQPAHTATRVNQHTHSNTWRLHQPCSTQCRTQLPQGDQCQAPSASYPPPPSIFPPHPPESNGSLIHSSTLALHLGSIHPVDARLDVRQLRCRRPAQVGQRLAHRQPCHGSRVQQPLDWLLPNGCGNAGDVLVALCKHSHVGDWQLQGAHTLLLRHQACGNNTQGCTGFRASSGSGARSGFRACSDTGTWHHNSSYGGCQAKCSCIKHMHRPNARHNNTHNTINKPLGSAMTTHRLSPQCRSWYLRFLGTAVRLRISMEYVHHRRACQKPSHQTTTIAADTSTNKPCPASRIHPKGDSTTHV